ncbi:MAG TPA: M14 family zinc carboxypeptidase [Gaiellaceae bacterium]|nr:M14 family zinc carboxypeptidase [Gaiellaceae bacterium]
MRGTLRAGRLAVLAVAVLALLVASGAGAQGGEAGEGSSVVEVVVADRAELDRLVGEGFDLDHSLKHTDDGIVVNAVVTPSERRELETLGFTIGATVQSAADLDQVLAERNAVKAAKARSAGLQLQLLEAENENLKVLRADWFTSLGTPQLSVEALHVDGASSSVTLQLEWDSGPGTPMGSGGSISLQRFVDAGVYMYHRRQTSAPVQPDLVRVTASTGDVVTAKVTEWLPPDDSPTRPRFEDFVDNYMDPTELHERINQLAAEFPELAEVRDLPFDTNGYRRKAQTILEPPGTRLVVDAPSPAAGTYGAVEASFGPDAPVAGVAGSVALVSDGSSLPSEGCNPLVGFPAGAIALVDRGSGPFTQKVLNAQAAGAVAVVVANNVPGDPFAMGGSAPGITIPAAMISQDDGATLKAGLPASGRLHGAPPLDPSRVVVESLAWGHEGGNDITIELVDPGAPSSPLAVSVMGAHIRVSLATGASGALASTAADVAAALNAGAGSVVRSYTYRGNDGDGIAQPQATTQLTDFLDAPAHVSRDPFQVQALVLGRTRDGSKPGVLAYAQEHAREWVPPLVTVETAERLLRNEAHDGRIRQLFRNLEIWIIPSVNPDGGHYSFYDDNGQRRNMTNHCEDDNSDPNRRDSWGVDNNRNYDYGSLFDGYSGASTSCLSDVFAGPSELSEPENRNLTWVVDENPNIRFSMNLHSSGNYFMWSPGAYALPGRVLLPRPDPGEEAYFYQASNRILTAIKRYRGLSVTPARTGPIADVLYSAAGNSGDRLWYVNRVFAWNFEVGTSFQPEWEEAHAETMEFANGLEELLGVAHDWSRDEQPPRSRLQPGGLRFTGPVDLTFDTPNEPAIVYYTLDGSRPTFENALRLESAGPRQGAAPITITETTTINWFSVDMAGNVELGYDPDNPASQNYQSRTIEIVD